MLHGVKRQSTRKVKVLQTDELVGEDANVEIEHEAFDRSV